VYSCIEFPPFFFPREKTGARGCFYNFNEQGVNSLAKGVPMGFGNGLVVSEPQEIRAFQFLE